MDVNNIKNFCNAQVGKGYDWAGIFLCQVLDFNIDNPNKWFCSEVLAAAFKMPRPNWYNPQRLLEKVINF
jgi:uncharacterized protein YycO